MYYKRLQTVLDYNKTRKWKIAHPKIVLKALRIIYISHDFEAISLFPTAYLDVWIHHISQFNPAWCIQDEVDYTDKKLELSIRIDQGKNGNFYQAKFSK